MYIDKDPFSLVHELHMKIEHGYKPTEEDIAEVTKIMETISRLLKPVIDEWISVMCALVEQVTEMMQCFPPEIYQQFLDHGIITLPEEGVEPSPPEEPKQHMHTTIFGNNRFVFVPSHYPPFPDDDLTIKWDPKSLDTGTED